MSGLRVMLCGDKKEEIPQEKENALRIGWQSYCAQEHNVDELLECRTSGLCFVGIKRKRFVTRQLTRVCPTVG